MSEKRNYNYSDVDMLMASKTIALSFKANIAELSTIRTNFTAEYADALIVRIDNAIDSNLGVDVKKGLRHATAALREIQIPALRDLSYFKIQIEDDFKKEPARQKEILKTLGFKAHLKDAKRSSQEALMELLYAFKQNMSADLKDEITAKGMLPALIDNIIAYANALSQANAQQENLKETSKEVTQGIRESFNAIYDEIIGICKIASNYYQYEPLKKEQFTFRRAIANLGAARRAMAPAI